MGELCYTTGYSMRLESSPLVEQHASWLAPRTIVGCPASCGYCFLKPEGLTRVAPQVQQSPHRAIANLLDSNLYQPHIPVVLGTETDMFATPSNREYLTDFTTLWNKQKLVNPLIMVTKSKIDSLMIDHFKRLKENGSVFIFFLSFSGLDNKIERGINHRELEQNFARLFKAGLNVIHYWRPLVPQNSKREVMDGVVTSVRPFTGTSVITGLAMHEGMRAQFDFWPQIQSGDIDLSLIETVYPAVAIENLKFIFTENGDHSFYYDTSCAVSHTLGQPNYNGTFTSSSCNQSQCPVDQRAICGSFHINRSIADEDVVACLKRLGLDCEYSVKYDDKRVPTLVVSFPLTGEQQINITHTLRVKVKAETINSVSYYLWGSGHNKNNRYILPASKVE